MTNTDIIIEVAKLDGWTFNKSKHGHWLIHSPDGQLHEPAFGTPKFNSSTGQPIIVEPLNGCFGLIPDYLTSRDAIIPVIEKQPRYPVQINIIYELTKHKEQTFDEKWCNDDVLTILIATPKQLCIALLKATGKWKDE